MANRPIHEIRLGKVKAAIWWNETHLENREWQSTAAAINVIRK